MSEPRPRCPSGRRTRSSAGSARSTATRSSTRRPAWSARARSSTRTRSTGTRSWAACRRCSRSRSTSTWCGRRSAGTKGSAPSARRSGRCRCATRRSTRASRIARASSAASTPSSTSCRRDRRRFGSSPGSALALRHRPQREHPEQRPDRREREREPPRAGGDGGERGRRRGDEDPEQRLLEADRRADTAAAGRLRGGCEASPFQAKSRARRRSRAPGPAPRAARRRARRPAAVAGGEPDADQPHAARAAAECGPTSVPRPMRAPIPRTLIPGSRAAAAWVDTPRCPCRNKTTKPVIAICAVRRAPCRRRGTTCAGRASAGSRPRAPACALTATHDERRRDERAADAQQPSTRNARRVPPAEASQVGPPPRLPPHRDRGLSDAECEAPFPLGEPPMTARPLAAFTLAPARRRRTARLRVRRTSAFVRPRRLPGLRRIVRSRSRSVHSAGRRGVPRAAA